MRGGRPSDALNRARGAARLAALAALLVISFVLTQVAAPERANAQEPTPTETPATTVRVDPTNQAVTAGDNVVVGIRVDNVQSLAAYEFELRYEPSVLSFSSVVNGPFLGSTGRSVTCLPPQFGEGTVRYGCVTFGSSPAPPSGSGLLATVTFTSSCEGTSPLDFTIASLADALGAGIPTQTQGGNASVSGGGACPTPTVTPTPGPATPTPSPTPTATATVAGPSPTPVPQLCAAATGAALCVRPPLQDAFTGSPVVVDIGVDNVTNLGAYQFALTFDSALLSPVAVQNRAFLGSTGRSVVCIQDILESRVEFACSTLGGEPPGPSGSGLLARVILEAGSSTGVSALGLENGVLATITSASIEVTSEQGGAVTIGLAPTATNTNTPTDTRTPTPTNTVPSPTPPDTPTPGPGSEPIVRIDPNTQQVVAGSDIVVDVVIDDVTDMGAFDFTVAYDPALLSFVDATNGPFLGSSGGSVVCVGPTANETLGTLNFACLSSGAPGVTGSGTLATVRLGTSCAGTSELTLANVDLADSTGAVIPTIAHHASAGVVGGSSCSPPATPTHTPTLTSTPAGPTPTTTVFIDPASQGVTEGDDVELDIVVDNVTSLGAYSFVLSYDSTVLALEDVANGPFLVSTGGTPFCIGPNVDVSLGEVQFGCTITSATAPSGSGVLATVRFGTFCGGTSPLNLVDLDLADSSGSPIATATQNGSATVIGSSTCPTPLPTSTSTPTRTPTSPAPTPSTNVNFSPSSQGVTEGADAVVDLEIDGAADLGAYEFTLSYDPTLFTVDSVTNGPFLGSTGGLVSCVGPSVSQAAGEVTFACLMTGAAGVSGSGVLANVRLNTSCTGSDVLALSSLDIADTAGQPIPVGSGTGEVTVLGATGCPTPAPPTNTPTPTPTGPTATPTNTPLPPTCDGTTTFTVCLQPESQTISQGNEAIYQVAVAASPELGAFQFTLRFDESITSVASVTPGTFLSSTFRVVTCLPTISPGSLQYVCVSLGPSPAGPTGSGILANVRLRGDSQGTTALTFEDVILTDINGESHPTPALEHGSLTVGAPATATPTFTPTDTPTITNTPTHTSTPTPCPAVCPTATNTPTPTNTSRPTNTVVPTNTPTFTPTPPSGPATMRVAPSSQTVPVGTIATVDIFADNVENLGAFQFRLHFNPAVTSFQSIVAGPFLGSTGRSIVCHPPIVEPDYVEYACASIGSSPPGPNGSGVLATVAYLTIAEGTSSQHIAEPIFADIAANKILPVVTQDGIITVEPAPTATPTETPTSSATITLTPSSTPSSTPSTTPTQTPGSPSLSGARLIPSGIVGTTARLVVGDPNSAPYAAAPAQEPGEGVVAVVKEPDAANLFLGGEQLVIYERAHNIPEGSGLGGFELAVRYNPDHVSLVIDAQPFEAALAGTNRVASCLTERAEGEVVFGCVSTGSDPGPTGTFDLARIHITPLEGLPLRPHEGNGLELFLQNVTGSTKLTNVLGSPIPVGLVGSAHIFIRILEGDLNIDCAVNVADQQKVAGRFGARKGSTLYDPWYDLSPNQVPDGDIDINDLQFVYGRQNSTCDEPLGNQDPPSKSTPTPTQTGTPGGPTLTPTPSTTASVTPTSTEEPAGTPEPSVTPTPSATATATATTVTGTPAPTSTQPVGTVTATPEGTPPTITPTSEVGPTETPTPTWTQVATWTPEPTWTQGPTWTPSVLTTPTPSPTQVEPTATNTPGTPGAATATPGAATATPTDAPDATSTDTPTPVSATSTPTTTPSSGVAPTATATPVSGIAPSTRQPVDGLPDTGYASRDPARNLTWAIALGLVTGLVLLTAATGTWWRQQRVPVPEEFRPVFRRAVTSGRRKR